MDPAERQKLLAKLNKLKALAECRTGNLNETATAAATMARLMAEYRIEMTELELELHEPEPDVLQEEITGQRKKGFPAWQTHLLSCIAHSNDCIAFQRRTPAGVRLCLLGAHDDIRQSRFPFQYCLDQIERLCQEWSPRAPVARKNDFRQGAAIAIGDRIRRAREAVWAQERAQHEKALVVLERRLEHVEEKAREIGIKAGRRPSSRSLEASAYYAGVEAGSGLAMPGEALPVNGTAASTL